MFPRRNEPRNASGRLRQRPDRQSLLQILAILAIRGSPLRLIPLFCFCQC
jgi:hypothetical protein